MAREVTSQVSAVPAFASADEALTVLESALGYLAAADATELPAQVQARSLQVLERADAIATAARSSILAAFTAGQGYCADADYSPRMWLITKTRITAGAAAGHLGWARLGNGGSAGFQRGSSAGSSVDAAGTEDVRVEQAHREI